MEGASIISGRGDDPAEAPVAEPLARIAPPTIDHSPADHIGAEAPDDEVAGRSAARWLVPALAFASVIAWLGGMGWLVRGRIASLAPEQVAELIAALAVPPSLLGIVWLLAMRSSRAEARRFGATAQAMRAEAASLERAVAVLSQHLERSRTHLAAQAESLLTLGGTAAERVATLGDDMTGAIAAIVEQGERLGDATGIARGSLDLLLSRLPGAQAETAAIGRQLAEIGDTAIDQSAALDARLGELATRGREAEAAAGGAATRLGEQMARIDASSGAGAERLDRAAAALAGSIDATLARATDAIGGEAEAALERTSRRSADALGERVAAIERAVARIGEMLDARRADGTAMLGDVDAGIARTDARLTALYAEGVERSRQLAASIGALGGSADAMTEALRTGEQVALRVIGTSEDLLVGLDAAAREIDETLPNALARLDDHIRRSRGEAAGARPELLALVRAAGSTHDTIAAIGGIIAEQRTTLDAVATRLAGTLAEGRAGADAMAGALDGAIDRADTFAGRTAPQIAATLTELRATAEAAAAHARQAIDAVLPDRAAAMEQAAGAAMRRATAGAVEREVAAIGRAADEAADVAARVAERLSRQMQAITEATADIERRIADAACAAAEQDGFARRASQLTEALNSAAIDIAKALSGDVADTAWAAYLKGDRGVFTRRAVRLLDGAQAREIAGLYDGVAGFRDQVNRYIHDFEAMLREVLANHNGSALGVTLLSSDMGKLYVALAQAIERLR